MVEPPDYSEARPHTPVLFHEVLSALHPDPGSRIIDGTVGAAGHAAGILDLSSPDGRLLGIDRDPAALTIARERLIDYGSRAILRHGSFDEIAGHAAEIGWKSVHGVLLDLGLSSMQLADPGRGFSFKEEGPLDMRLDPSQSIQAADLINNLSEGELAEILSKHGEEPKSKTIARAIVRARPIESTKELSELIARTAGRRGQRIHPATRTFQALRIAVNDELNVLQSALPQAVELLEPRGRLVVIAFHSLEDRIVKQFFKHESLDCDCPPEQPVCTCDKIARLRVLTKRPIRPSEEEISRNPRARSARMRVAERKGLA
ncbi:MAG: 16S rRNA (cytosine(1402)-N(4))-methyltransferase RsmH [Anaerolineales bacterium]|nr:16S rRNA (cytosine(1402)-N(4))-methyltransferase RsmH [Anaerolineales bacterium]